MAYGTYILDDKEQPQLEPDVTKWGRWYESADRNVLQTQINGEVRVSTVFLGLDHQFGDGPPVLWETMIFGGPFDQREGRYATRADALSGHAALCQCARESAEA